MICQRCHEAPATCDVTIGSAKRGYPRLVLCAQCYRSFDWDAAGRASRRLMRAFDGETTLLSREQIRRVRFLQYYTQPEAGSTGMPLIPPKLMEATPGRPLDFLGRL